MDQPKRMIDRDAETEQGGPGHSEADPDLFKRAPDQPWERFRGNVAAHQAKEAEGDHKDRWSSIEHRLQWLESRIETQGQKIQHMEVTIVRQLEFLTMAYQSLAANLTESLGKLVTKDEFKPVQWLSYLSAASVFLMGLALLVSRTGSH